MTFYADSTTPVSAATEVFHQDELLSFARPGTWGTAAMRTAVAAQARKARCEAGVQESIGDESMADIAELPAAARRLTRSVAMAGIDIDREYCKQVQAEGVAEGAYVEIVGVVARLAHLDVFARGIGVPSRALEEPIEDGNPSYEIPEDIHQEGFFTATIPSPPSCGKTGTALFGKHQTPNILRSLSLVPAEARRLIAVLDNEYFSLETMMDMTYSSHDALSRPQLELVAARVSALNQCFY